MESYSEIYIIIKHRWALNPISMMRDLIWYGTVPNILARSPTRIKDCGVRNYPALDTGLNFLLLTDF
jgi:hypothetical protein